MQILNTVKWAAVAALMAGPILAQDQVWPDRDSDTLLSQSDLQDRLTGRTLVFFDGGTSAYKRDGTYQWTYAGGGDWHGMWRTMEGSVVCVDFITEVTRCDRIVESSDRLVVLTADGQRFPVKTTE
ncbi:hypothetical protein [Thalassovita mediterranea]|jgi:hypothetical protein|uniref:DUF995 domain-containing protein n=1 Tax=Thalassovita mediterranea TaxID=340021 RepID=A0A0P1GL58_9RHOB|nr:hypothetical protein [Thalassovita mediterranea]CUH82844.1 hypothetical protein TM5383_00026 [Thalassovita mediterranea]SIS31525.1 hypothetical protein SAMN05421685_104247 [Thalassovita mediterranea]